MPHYYAAMFFGYFSVIKERKRMRFALTYSEYQCPNSNKGFVFQLPVAAAESGKLRIFGVPHYYASRIFTSKVIDKHTES